MPFHRLQFSGIGERFKHPIAIAHLFKQKNGRFTQIGLLQQFGSVFEVHCVVV